MANHVEAASNNFLLPNATFFAELLAFLLILGFIWRYVVPVVQRGMRRQEETLRQQLADSEKAKEQLAEAQAAYQNALTEARSEAARIRENARAEAQRTIEELRTAAQEESARIVARGEEQLEHQRSAIVRELRGEIGTLAVELSEKIISQRLADDAQVRQTVDVFLAGLEAQDTASSGTGGTAGPSA
jgi:F-type H+-transporting ATPase subunit b